LASFETRSRNWAREGPLNKKLGFVSENVQTKGFKNIFGLSLMSCALACMMSLGIVLPHFIPGQKSIQAFFLPVYGLFLCLQYFKNSERVIHEKVSICIFFPAYCL